MSIFHVDMLVIVMHYDGMAVKKFKSLAPPEKYCKCEFKDVFGRQITSCSSIIYMSCFLCGDTFMNSKTYLNKKNVKKCNIYFHAPPVFTGGLIQVPHYLCLTTSAGSS